LSISISVTNLSVSSKYIASSSFCPLHFGNLQIFKHPKYLLAGESESHPWVVKRNRLEDLIRFAQLVQATTSSIMTLDSISKLSEIDSDDDDDDDNIPSYYDEQQ
jgi:hypothetical protein